MNMILREKRVNKILREKGEDRDSSDDSEADGDENLDDDFDEQLGGIDETMPPNEQLGEHLKVAFYSGARLPNEVQLQKKVRRVQTIG